jgi:hypothetical protein
MLLDSKEVNLIYLDDLMEECKDNPEIAKIFTLPYKIHF